MRTATKSIGLATHAGWQHFDRIARDHAPAATLPRRWNPFPGIGGLAALLVGLVGGCGGSYDDFAKQRDRVRCEALYRCCGGGATVIDPMQPDVASCEAALDARIEPTIAMGISQGALRFDDAAGKRCLAALTKAYADCSQPLDLTPTLVDCAAVLTGKGKPGSPCSIDLDCDATSTCVIATTAGGTCVAYAASGQPCGACAPGSACLPSKTCGAPQAQFAPCGSNAQCESGLCSQPCVVTGVTTDPDGTTHAVVENDFCPMGCDANGDCIVGQDAMGHPVTSSSPRCAPAPTAMKALCTPPTGTMGM